MLPYLFLPEAFAINLPGLPDLDKTFAITGGLIVGLLFFAVRGRKAPDVPALKTEGFRFRFVLYVLLAVLIGGVFVTIRNNGEWLVFGPTVLPALRPWDAIGRIAELIIIALPFFVARKYLATPDMHRALLKVFALSGLIYTLFMLVEFRLSPQLHNWVYGFHQHSFLQHIRDGYRPMVFLQHGLWVGFFIFMAVMAAAALWKAEKETKWLWALGWLLVILMVSKNLGAFVIGLMCLAVFFALRRKMQIWFVICVSLATLSFPALRQAHLVPIDSILSAAASISEDRAGSLEYRLDQEDQLLARAYEKPLFGWGTWGRDRIYNEFGSDISVTDGLWIIVLGGWGWVGYAGFFGVLAAPLLFLAATARRKEIPPETIALALICAGNFIYLIPNATLTPIGLLCFGALAGFVQFDRKQEPVDVPDAVLQGRRAPRSYTRFPHKVAQRRGAPEI
ncbi:hypothetical protein [Loktanella sp. 5RATIMAR09]|uniref:hypothetical protein n=1 Tax=Loktanella sp. 5RATIMAR09 TaxID=1225655 RepID=UPI0012EEA760|nr:hypothetical protein [Loktanella sp. 5RATIMAR09]